MSDPNEVAEQTLEELWSELPAQAQSVLGVDVSLAKMRVKEGLPDADGNYVALLTADSPRSVDIFLIFDVQSAIAFAGMLVMMQEKAIRERMARKEMDEDELDAMGECVNQMASCFNTSLRNALGEDFHVRFSEGGLEAPGQAAEYEGQKMVCGEGKISIGKIHTGTVRIVFPMQFFSDGSGDDGSTGLELSAEEQAAIRQATLEGLEEPNGAVVVLTSERERTDWEVVMSQTGLDNHVLTEVYEVRGLCRQGECGTIVIDADTQPSGGIPALVRLLSWSDVNVPILVAASQPTRTHLVSCLASGASSYLVKPVPYESLRERVAEVCAVWDGGKRAAAL